MNAPEMAQDFLQDYERTAAPTVPQKGYRHHLIRKKNTGKASRVVAVVPQRSRDGYWTHPRYFSPERNTEGPGEFNAWLAANELECSIRWMYEEATPDLERTEHRDNGSIRNWHPAVPPGSGWFIGSLHDTSQGAVCIWLRCQRAL
ncbi:hypothetical protein [Erwinia aphidicola]|uniref:hypothetical protein n=1 Tax=Erwinia aphidicola TaxID=68334 RepID=UPI003CF3420A